MIKPALIKLTDSYSIALMEKIIGTDIDFELLLANGQKELAEERIKQLTGRQSAKEVNISDKGYTDKHDSTDKLVSTDKMESVAKNPDVQLPNATSEIKTQAVEAPKDVEMESKPQEEIFASKDHAVDAITKAVEKPSEAEKVEIFKPLVTDDEIIEDIVESNLEAEELEVSLVNYPSSQVDDMQVED
jgi:hypothetical protein